LVRSFKGGTCGIFNTDQGAQFTSKLWIQTCQPQAKMSYLTQSKMSGLKW
jgi:hypothetical protein